MPIIVVSTEGPNINLKDFKTMDLVVDIMLHSNDPSCREIVDSISQMCTVIHQIPVHSLDAQGPEESIEDVRIRVESVVETIRQMKVRTAMIVSHLSVLKANPENSIDGEWDLINL